MRAPKDSSFTPRRSPGRDGRSASAGTGPTLTYAGTGVFSPDFFSGIAVDAVVKLRPLLDAAIADGFVSGERHNGQWVDVGTPERLYELDQHLSRHGHP